MNEKLILLDPLDSRHTHTHTKSEMTKKKKRNWRTSTEFAAAFESCVRLPFINIVIRSCVGTSHLKLHWRGKKEEGIIIQVALRNIRDEQVANPLLPFSYTSRVSEALDSFLYFRPQRTNKEQKQKQQDCSHCDPLSLIHI